MRNKLETPLSKGSFPFKTHKIKENKNLVNIVPTTSSITAWLFTVLASLAFCSIAFYLSKDLDLQNFDFNKKEYQLAAISMFWGTVSLIFPILTYYFLIYRVSINYLERTLTFRGKKYLLSNVRVFQKIKYLRMVSRGGGGTNQANHKKVFTQTEFNAVFNNKKRICLIASKDQDNKLSEQISRISKKLGKELVEID